MKDNPIVQARYLGDTPVVMPDLLGRERPGTPPWDGTGINPQCLVSPGDVIPLDKASAEGRADFEIVDKPKKES
jgi:hypothetical protein